MSGSPFLWGPTGALALAPPGSANNFLKTDGSGNLSFGVPAVYAFNVTSQSSTYGASINDYILASGASFTITLPTAAGVSGQPIVIQHNGTSLTQVYTLNTTSSQTIGGIAGGSYALYTNGEALTLISDGSNWQILNHKMTTAWTSYTPTFVGLGTVGSIEMYSRRISDSLEVRGRFTTGPSFGAATASMTLGFGGVNNNATIAGITAINSITLVGAAAYNSTSSGNTPTVLATSGGTVVNFGLISSTTSGTVAQNGSAIFAASQQVDLYFQVPIAGWQP